MESDGKKWVSMEINIDIKKTIGTLYQQFELTK